jgi:hypothetical protein
MKIVLSLLIFSCLFANCVNKSFTTEQLSKLSVIRQTQKVIKEEFIHSDTNTIVSSVKTETKIETHQQTTKEKTAFHFHIIVASYAPSEKLKAEKLVQQLKAENHPVSLLFSTKRYRVSIASFATEKEANAALPRYKAITQRKDIWIYKTSSKEEA